MRLNFLGRPRSVEKQLMHAPIPVHRGMGTARRKGISDNRKRLVRGRGSISHAAYSGALRRKMACTMVPLRPSDVGETKTAYKAMAHRTTVSEALTSRCAPWGRWPHSALGYRPPAPEAIIPLLASMSANRSKSQSSSSSKKLAAWPMTKTALARLWPWSLSLPSRFARFRSVRPRSPSDLACGFDRAPAQNWPFLRR